MQECIIILGMHRSGTSVLAGLISILGSYTGSNLMPPSKDNPKGYFENNEIVGLNESILRENGVRWDSYDFTVNQINSEKFQHYVTLAKHVIQEQLKYVKKIIIKDPRINILFPIWEQALKEMGIKIKIVLAYRNPLEVAFSLKVRDDMRVEKSLILWSHHFFLSELYSRKYERFIVYYDHDLNDLDLFIKRLAEFTNNELNKEKIYKSKEFYSPDLKHHNIDIENISDDSPDYLIKTIDLLKKGHFDDDKHVDVLRNEFYRSRDFYLGHVKDCLVNLDKEELNNIENTNKIKKLEINIAELTDVNKALALELDNTKNSFQTEKDDFELKIEKMIAPLKKREEELTAEKLKSQDQIQQLNESLNNKKTLESELENLNLSLQRESVRSQNEKQSLLTEIENLKKEIEIKERMIIKNNNKISLLEIGLVNNEDILRQLIEDSRFKRRIKNDAYVVSLIKFKKLFLPFASRKNKRLWRDQLLIIESGLFSSLFYLSMYPDVKKSGIKPLTHYCKYGWKEGRKPSRDFDLTSYMVKHPNLIKAGINPLVHFVQARQKHSRKNSLMDDPVRSSFDEAFYLATYADVRDKGIDPFTHFMTFGWKEGRDPSPGFSTQFYLEANPDVQKAGINPLVHYLDSGKKENRAPKLTERRKIKPGVTSPSILFVGHSGAQGGAEVVLLDVIKWYAENTTYQITILLLAPGILSSQYLKYGNVLTLNDNQELFSEKTASFLAFQYDLIYLNTVVSGIFSQVYKKNYAKFNTPVVLHVHEMEKIINLYKKEFESIVNYVDLFIAASVRVKNDLTGHFSISPERISVHHSFVENLAENPSQLARKITAGRAFFGVKDSDVLIMGAGTVNWRKGPDLFLETLSKLIAQSRTVNIVAIWMGAGEDLEKIREQVDEKGLGEQIRFVGFLKNASELVAAADIFFLSSREDPFPLVCLEAAQFKAPVVCFEKATGMVEFIQDDAGVALPEFDTATAALSLLNLVQNQPLREQLGHVARARFMESYSTGAQLKNIFHELKTRYQFKPSLSVIVPNYNHAKYLNERIDSVLNQDFYDLEILLLDDASTDDSFQVMQQYSHDRRTRIITNKKCSGSPFKQWKKGIHEAKSDYIWIAESDDSCTRNLVGSLLQAFNDEKVVLSYCKSEIIDEFGALIPNALDPYMNRAHPDKFKTSYVRDGNEEVEENFAVACTIVNASSLIFKKMAVAEALDDAMQYKMCGDWLLYLKALGNGKIAYTIEAKNYFRRHQHSTVHVVEGTDLYFQERFKISSNVVKNFNLSDATLKRMFKEIDSEWERFAHIDKKLAFNQSFNKDEIIKEYKKHVVRPMKIGFYVHGFMFSKGGIERLAADLANYLVSRGHDVVIYCRVFKGNSPVYQLNESIQVVPIFDEKNQETTIPKMREHLKSSYLDVFVPMLSEWIFEPVVSAAEGLGFPIIASEHNNPYMIEKKWWSHEGRVKTFEKVDLVHLLRESYKNSLPGYLHNKIRIIQNGSYLANGIKVQPNKTFKRVLAIGRLSPQKRFDRLIHAFALATKNIDKDWVLDIYGEGPLQEELQNLINHYELGNRIKLRGNNEIIAREYLTSDIFVLSSEFEGDPVVIVEAKMFGLPCIAYQDCPGANEAIKNEVDGLLAKPDENGGELSKAIINLVNNEGLRRKLSKQALINSRMLNMRHIASQWENVLFKTVVKSIENHEERKAN